MEAAAMETLRASNDGNLRDGEFQSQSIHQYQAGNQPQGEHGLPHGEPRCLVDIDAVNVGGLDCGHGPRQGVLANLGG
jgi:hypothetical protein